MYVEHRNSKKTEIFRMNVEGGRKIKYVVRVFEKIGCREEMNCVKWRMMWKFFLLMNSELSDGNV